VLPLNEFRRYFTTMTGTAAHPEGGAQLWERQALTRARVVFGDPGFAAEVMQAVFENTYGLPWQQDWIDEIAAMRDRLEASRSPRDLKRGPGGLADIEFLVQLLQLKYGQEIPGLRTTNTWQALSALREGSLIDAQGYTDLRSGYDFLLRVQNRLRIVHNRTLDAVPESPDEVEKLARRLGFDSGTKFLDELDRHRGRVRELYRALLSRERASRSAETRSTTNEPRTK
jgi:glutamate-ammonia-ligase adenylyltransferase